jgi:hypothetical protein
LDVKARGLVIDPKVAVYAPLRLSPAKTTPFQVDEDLLDLPKEVEKLPATK